MASNKRSAPHDELFELERDRNKRFRQSLDAADAEQAQRQSAAIAAAANRHQLISEHAKAAFEHYLREQHLAAAEVAAKEQVEHEQAIAARQAQLLATQQQADLLRQQNEQAAADERQKQLDAARQAAKAAQQAVQAAQEPIVQQVPPQQTPNPVSVPVPAPVKAVQLQSTSDEHHQYLAVHRHLKELRTHLAKDARLHKPLKTYLGDNRREITKTVGQMTSGASAKQANRGRIQAIVSVLQAARQQQQQTVDVRRFAIASRFSKTDLPESEYQISSVFIYLINIFVKVVIKQFIAEADKSPEKAEPVGILVANIFSHQELKWPSQPAPPLDGSQPEAGNYLADILLAKFHKGCPVLFGVTDPKSLQASNADSNTVSALGAGFASVTTRDFSRAKTANPLPVWLYWQSVARIINTPPVRRLQAQYIVLKAMLAPVYAEKLCKFYGTHGVALLRKAIEDFPSHSQTTTANALKVLPDLYGKEFGLKL